MYHLSIPLNCKSLPNGHVRLPAQGLPRRDLEALLCALSAQGEANCISARAGRGVRVFTVERCDSLRHPTYFLLGQTDVGDGVPWVWRA
ncbi:hypothetical protein HNR42_002503 [Deinobacterium chartae]|uniref:Uncharacterized protein n=1 Tax=Deinobacterium chartae TaxID=521158 RepID=A0A841I089_9DEIO|nr:hypothetical protein [Deinobacterium chartae]MBB6099067.1 hypothetical protein [Deinobacterium chartae]